MSEFDVSGVLRKIRRIVDLSQREMARALDVSKSYLAGAESGASGLDVRVLSRAAAMADLRLVVVDHTGAEVTPMSGEAVRDRSGRRFPAHLDTRYSDDGWWHGPHRYHRTQPSYTFDRRRDLRDRNRERVGTPDDHQLPQPGDSPGQRAEARRRMRWAAGKEERERRFLAGEFADVREAFFCTCPGECDHLDDRSGTPVHADGCPCQCDIA